MHGALHCNESLHPVWPLLCLQQFGLRGDRRYNDLSYRVHQDWVRSPAAAPRAISNIATANITTATADAAEPPTIPIRPPHRDGTQRGWSTRDIWPCVLPGDLVGPRHRSIFCRLVSYLPSLVPRRRCSACLQSIAGRIWLHIWIHEEQLQAPASRRSRRNRDM